MSLLEINSIDVFYGDVQVIFDLSLKVEKGEVVSIIGGNGAGKSTLLKTISGLLSAANGEVIFNDAPIHNAPPEEIVARGIVHVPEGRRLFSLMTVLDNLLVGAYNRRASEHADKTLAQVYALLPRLQERSNQMAMTLSGGEQQVVAIGRGRMAMPHARHGETLDAAVIDSSRQEAVVDHPLVRRLVVYDPLAQRPVQDVRQLLG